MDRMTQQPIAGAAVSIVPMDGKNYSGSRALKHVGSSDGQATVTNVQGIVTATVLAGVFGFSRFLGVRGLGS